MRMDHFLGAEASESPFVVSEGEPYAETIGPLPGQARKPRLSEESDSYPFVLVQLDERHRLIACRDDIQWIHQIRRGKAWRGDGYFRTRAGLMRRCGGLSLRAAKIIAALPERYIEGHPRRKGGA